MNLLLLLYDIHTHGKTKSLLHQIKMYINKIVEDNLGGLQRKKNISWRTFEYVDRYVMHSDENALHNTRTENCWGQILMKD